MSGNWQCESCRETFVRRQSLIDHLEVELRDAQETVSDCEMQLDELEQKV